MAKILLGPLASAMSGSQGGTTFSHNRFGAYTRSRVIPTRATSTAAQNAKGRLGQISAAWRDLSSADRAAWSTWAQNNPITDTLGQKQVLPGHAAFVQINTRLQLAGNTLVDVPPISTAPEPLESLTLTADIGSGTFALAFAATPLAASEKLWVQVAVVNSAGINYVENLLKLVKVSDAAQATGLVIESDVVARFGTLSVGQKVVARVAVFDTTTGLLSSPLQSEAIVTEAA